MDTQDYTTDHRKGQYLLRKNATELKYGEIYGWSIHRIAKHPGMPYNTIENEIGRANAGKIFLPREVALDRRGNIAYTVN